VAGADGDGPAVTLPNVVVDTRDLRFDEAGDVAVEGKVRADIKKAPLDDINAIFADLKAGKVEGRMVLDFSEPIVRRRSKSEAMAL
jgi:alcohol dehydrogenase, propanol-preferring